MLDFVEGITWSFHLIEFISLQYKMLESLVFLNLRHHNIKIKDWEERTHEELFVDIQWDCFMLFNNIIIVHI